MGSVESKAPSMHEWILQWGEYTQYTGSLYQLPILDVSYARSETKTENRTRRLNLF